MHFIDNFTNDKYCCIKNPCDSKCDFKDKDLNIIPVVGVGLPQRELKGVIISRDPTTDFRQVFWAHINGTGEEWHDLIREDAPPQWLLSNINAFRLKYLHGEYSSEMAALTRLMGDNVYWTHLHKCCTYNKKDKKDNIKKYVQSGDDPAVKIPFRFKNARRCANIWLDGELQDAIDIGAEFIICLGGDVKKCVKLLEPDLGIQKYQIFYLPHPSGAANGEWFNDERVNAKGLAKKIESLLIYCGKTIV